MNSFKENQVFFKYVEKIILHIMILIILHWYAFMKNSLLQQSAVLLILFLGDFYKCILRRVRYSGRDENRSETVSWGNYHFLLLSQATKRFKLNGNGATLITSCLVMTLISAIFFPVDWIMTSSLISSMLLLLCGELQTFSCTFVEHEKKIPNSQIRLKAPPHCTAPSSTAKPIYIPLGRRKGVRVCELEWLLNISITAHQQWEWRRVYEDAAGLGARRCGSSSEGWQAGTGVISGSV